MNNEGNHSSKSEIECFHNETVIIEHQHFRPDHQGQNEVGKEQTSSSSFGPTCMEVGDKAQ